MIGLLKGRLWNGSCQARLTSMVRNSRQHWMTSRRLAFAEQRTGSNKLSLSRAISYKSVCISSPQCSIWSSWLGVDTEDVEEETLGHRTSPIMERCGASTDLLVEPSSFDITYVDPDIAGMRVGESNTQVFSWHWPGDDESILPIVTSIVDMTI